MRPVTSRGPATTAMPLQLRNISAGSLQYVLICEREPISAARLPASLRSVLLDFALTAPKSFDQILHPLATHAGQLAHASYQPVQFSVCYADTLTAVLPYMASDKILCVFLLYNPAPAVLAAVSAFPNGALVTAIRAEDD